MRGHRLHIATRDKDRLGAGKTVIELQYQDQNESVQLSPPSEWTTPPLTKKHRLKRIFSLKKIRRENGRSRWELGVERLSPEAPGAGRRLGRYW